MAAHTASAKPPPDVVLENAVMLIRMASSSVNHAHTTEAGANRLQQKLIQNEPRFLKVQPVQVNMRLNGKTPRPQIIQVKPPARMDATFNVFAGLLEVDITILNKLLERAQRVLLLILRLNLDRRAVLQRY